MVLFQSFFWVFFSVKGRLFCICFGSGLEDNVFYILSCYLQFIQITCFTYKCIKITPNYNMFSTIYITYLMILSIICWAYKMISANINLSL